MLKILRSRENIPLVSAAAILLMVVFAWFAPAEATLGKAVKLVYVHAAMMWVGIGLISLGGIAGLLFLFFRNEAIIRWSSGSAVVGVALFALTGFLGAVTAKITWGGVFWAEPRMAMLGQIFFVAAVAAIAVRISGSKTIAGLANLGLGIITWVLIIRTERVIHPDSPIFRSDSTAIKVFPLLIAAMITIAGLQIVRYWMVSEEK